MATLSAGLFIASEPNQIRDLQWRVKLVDSQKLYPADKLVALLKRICKESGNPPSIKERHALSNLAINEKFEFDEFDQAVLFTVALLKNPNGISNDVAIKTDGIMNFQFLKYDGTVDDFANESDIKQSLEYRKKNLKRHADNLIKHDCARIRAYLAFKEIAALFDPDTMIPHLVGISPKYLASPLTQKWITKQQYDSKFGDSPAKIEAATENLKRLTKAISGDKRQNKKRERPYWKIGFIYDDLVSYIEGFRRQQKECSFDREYFEIYCEHHEIPNHLKALILASTPTPSELAIEIMIFKKVIKSEKTFREIQPKLNKIQKRHFDGNILSIASDISPVVFNFIDIPGTNPEFINRIDLFKYLENVEIPNT